MFHLFIKGDQETLLQKILKTSNETKVWGFAHVQESDMDGYCKLEWYVGDATLDVPTSVMEGFVRKILE